MMNEEKQGAEREQEAKAIRAQHAADLEHLLKNTHPSLRGSISLGDASDGTTQTVGDYAAIIFKNEIEQLKEEIFDLRMSHVSVVSDLTTTKQNLEALRLQVLADSTPETPAEEENPFAKVPGIGAKAEEFAPTPTPTVVENGVTVLQPTAPTEAPEKNL